MESELIKYVAQGGSGVAAIVMAIIFMRYISRRDDAMTKYIEESGKAAFEQTERFTGIMQGHMQQEKDAFTSMERSLTKNTETLEEMHRYFRSLNGNLKKRK